jgi:hypothetical protein
MDKVYTVSQSVSVEVTPVNDPPVLEIEQHPIIYNEDDGDTIIIQSASVSDLDSSHFNNGHLIVDFVEPHADNLLGIRSQGTDPGLISIGGQTELYWGNNHFAYFTGGLGVTPLTIDFVNAYADAAAISTLIECITYANTSQRPIEGTTLVRFKLDDGNSGISVTKNQPDYNHIHKRSAYN